METLDDEDGEGDKVKFSVSHTDLAESIHPLGKTWAEVRVQAQGNNSNPKNKTTKNLKDATNKLEPRPSIAKPSRPITKTSGGLQNKDTRILKRPGEVW